ncbi:hypothetical protein ACRALDRAFT_2030303 [Sodiomyces alcalophilus JCM 7366]|uniref:uncharacterized protein n=1 Tax=Sodiomyces alcalophilus JCM 7366 TaxID=591952 RepID=UPI0039B3B600
MAKQPDQEEPASRQASRLSWLTSRGSSAESSPSPESSSASSPSSSSSTTVISNWDNVSASDLGLDPDGKLPEKHLTKVDGKLDPSVFQNNSLKEQPHNPDSPTIRDAVKTIKAEDFLNVGKVPCARNGYIYGIMIGGLVGGFKFIMKAPVPKVANWAVGSTIAGAAASFEWCQYRRRQERVRMQRAVEVFQHSMKEKQREAEAKRLEQEEAAKKEAEATKQRSWYTLW